ncbi:MTAP family purine nucleoside phosphorylase [Arthrobacter sp. H14-L1]|uniref:MTAP family purine nucleoside phosphorylase n=1 Tax=Arthrobacter sp. H14-L1 TaxID=2996697 RepID=UPI00226F7E02|nr:MTAP family purine nucleoside phosphorylase [Arthrobacter sp. H14-L1]MCY0904412.1 MTAP family purine nucleoside phosphorylase [Arthrobacter sp. H14-L1]
MTEYDGGSNLARIGIIGGSGTQHLPGSQVLDVLTPETPYGPTSGPVSLARVGGQTVAFLARHGAGHSLPPQQINYRANLWALKSLGVEGIISSSAVGGLRPGYAPETFVLTDQLIDRTTGRIDTYFDGSLPTGVRHLPATEPFCGVLRRHLRQAVTARGLPFQAEGTVVVINGPRFSTRAESAWYVSGGADIISMTQYPEPVLAAELNMGFANLAYVTDSDTGHDGSAPVTAEAVFGRLKTAQPHILAVLEAAVSTLDECYRAPQLMDPEAVRIIMDQPVSGPSAHAAPGSEPAPAAGR